MRGTIDGRNADALTPVVSLLATMLELRPNCELCDRDLPPNAADARICSYECTFCAACVEDVLYDVCPSAAAAFSHADPSGHHASRGHRAR